MDQFECVVVGAGVVGLAVARALALQGREVLLLEACHAIGTQTSSRSSEVIHAGIYYPAGSLKARLCVQGKTMLYAYCEQRGIAHRRCGKLIVATQASQLQDLQAIRQRAEVHGVLDLELLSATQAQALEPALQAHGALLSPSTGIVDSHGFMLSLLGDFENAGGCLALNSPLRQVQQAQGVLELVAVDGTAVSCHCLVNAAGHHAPYLARSIQGLDPVHVPTAYYAKGNYFSLSGPTPFSRLIYPVPEAAGLGVHLTLDMGGQARFGPDVQWVGSPDDLVVDPGRAAAFYAEIRKYWPALADATLLPAYAGIRPKTHGPHEPASDFVIQGRREHGVVGLVNLFGIESPGLTAALAIGQHVVDLLAQ